jgi:hypothetical protein
MKGWVSSSAYDKFYLSTTEELVNGDAMQFPGFPVDEQKQQNIQSLLKKDHLFFWTGTKGEWDRKLYYTNADQAVITEWLNDPMISANITHTAYDNITHTIPPDLQLMDSENAIKWTWTNDMTVNRSVQIETYQDYNFQLPDVLNKYVFRLPYSQTVTSSDANIACFRINCETCDIDKWDSILYTSFAGETHEHTIEKHSDECYVVSLFDDTQTHQGEILNKGVFHKMTQALTTLPTNKDNRILEFWVKTS